MGFDLEFFYWALLFFYDFTNGCRSTLLLTFSEHHQLDLLFDFLLIKLTIGIDLSFGW